MQKRLNLWQRLKPECKEAIKEQYKKYTYRRADIKEELKSKEFFNHNLSPKAYSTIKDYVYRETQVVRMVIIGQTIQNWIESQKNLKI